MFNAIILWIVIFSISWEQSCIDAQERNELSSSEEDDDIEEDDIDNYFKKYY